MDNNTAEEGSYDNMTETIIPYPCPMCKEVFLSESGRAEHIQNEHEDQEMSEYDDLSYYAETTKKLVYQCHRCQQTFPNADALAVHCRDEHPHEIESAECVCGVCSEKFPNKTYLKYHYDKYHAEPVEHKCTMCLKVCSTKPELDTHRKLCPKNLFPCDYCKFRFPSRRSVYQHIRNCHRKNGAGAANVKKKFTCLFCGKKFVRRQDMETHQRTHTGDKPFKCKTCGKGFVSNSEMHHHMPTHANIRGYRCQFCGIAYKNISTLTHHRRVKHLNPVKVPCPFPECPYVGPSEKLLKCHIRTQHIEFKAHACECGKTFSSRSHLYDHRRRKHDPNPAKSYQCSAPDCSKVFTKRFMAERHYKRAHVGGTEDFKCCKCFRTFAHEETLKQHYSTHSGSRFYYCPKCFTVIATEKGIINHMAQCKEDEEVYQEPKNSPSRPIIKQEVVDNSVQEENIQYEFVVDQLEPDPKFDEINMQVEAMLKCEKGEEREGFSAEDLAKADEGIAQLPKAWELTYS